MFIKTHIYVVICGSIENHNMIRDLLKTIDDQFIESVMLLASTLIIQFSTLRLIGVKGVCDHIMHMTDIEAQLKSLEVTISESFLVQYILCTLPPQYSPFKISYNTHNKDWSISELLTMCVQEEERLLVEQGEKVLSLFPTVKGRIMLRTRKRARLNPKQASRRNPHVSFVKRRDT